MSYSVVHDIGKFCRIGGVELVTQHGKIKAENTLDSRLEMMSHQVQLLHMFTKQNVLTVTDVSLGGPPFG